MNHASRIERVFLTGATGFIGGRLAEVLCQRGISCRSLVRNWNRAARLARLPVEMIEGDVLNPAKLAEAMTGCDVVVHAAVDNRASGREHRRVSEEGTANVFDVARRCGARRIVHLSSIAVFGYNLRPDAATEEGRPRKTGDPYCDGKIAAERIAQDQIRSGAPGVILRPTIVYGPWGGLSVDLVERLRAGTLPLIDGGSGVCNTLYVDNLIEAVFRAVECDRAVGEIFHISDAEPVSWRDFLEAHARLLPDGDRSLPSAKRSDIRLSRRNSLSRIADIVHDPRTQYALMSVPVVKKARQFLYRSHRIVPRFLWSSLQEHLPVLFPAGPGSSNGRPAPFRLSPTELSIYTNPVSVRIDKSRRILGYNPTVDFREGMRRTVEWLRWARVTGP